MCKEHCRNIVEMYERIDGGWEQLYGRQFAKKKLQAKNLD